jgi:hypothetical protein
VSLHCTGLSATGPHQRCHSRARVPQNTGPYLTLSFERAFPFCRLLRLAVLRWNCSNRSVEAKHILQLTVRSVSSLHPVTSNSLYYTSLGTMFTQVGDSCYVAHSLTRGPECNLQYCRSSPAKSFSGVSPAEIMTISPPPPTGRGDFPYLTPRKSMTRL